MRNRLEQLEKVKDILVQAIEREQAEYEFYLWCEKTVTIRNLRDMLKELGSSEKHHMVHLEHHLEEVREEIDRLKKAA